MAIFNSYVSLLVPSKQNPWAVWLRPARFRPIRRRRRIQTPRHGTWGWHWLVNITVQYQPQKNDGFLIPHPISRGMIQLCTAFGLGVQQIYGSLEKMLDSQWTLMDHGEPHWFWINSGPPLDLILNIDSLCQREKGGVDGWWDLVLWPAACRSVSNFIGSLWISL